MAKVRKRFEEYLDKPTKSRESEKENSDGVKTMQRQRDFLEYHKSIAAELQATKNRVQNLIADKHWLTVGENKEAILRKVLRCHIAETLHVGTGFVCGPHKTSHQTDILISSRDKPILFQEGELRIITPDMAMGIVEVKTNTKIKLRHVLQTLADDVEMIRSNGNQQCMAGLFIYELDKNNVKNENDANNQAFLKRRPQLDRWEKVILRLVSKVANGDKNRVINWIAAGPDIFVRYWCEGGDIGSNVHEPVWHSYFLKDLAHAYFLSNLVWDTCPHLELNMQYAWFPAEGGKERYRQWYVGLNDTQPRRF